MFVALFSFDGATTRADRSHDGQFMPQFVLAAALTDVRIVTTRALISEKRRTMASAPAAGRDRVKGNAVMSSYNSEENQFVVPADITCNFLLHLLSTEN